MPISPNARPYLFALLLVAVGSALSLACLAVLHSTLDWSAVARFDHGLQMAVHAHASPGLTVLLRSLTFVGAMKCFVPALTLGLGYLAARGRIFEAKTMGLAMLGAIVLNESFKLVFQRPRPGLPWSIGDEHTFSFPSGHSLFAVVLYGMLAWLALRGGKRWPLTFAVVMPLAIGLSRIYLGMHYPTDVLGGYIVGLIWLGTVIAIGGGDKACHLDRSAGR